MTAAPAYLSLDPAEVQHGDVLAGVSVKFMHPIESILSDGVVWWFGDGDGHKLATVRGSDKVQVIRIVGEGHSAEARPSIGVASSPTLSDDCPPRGITRSRGSWMLVP